MAMTETAPSRLELPSIAREFRNEARDLLNAARDIRNRMRAGEAVPQWERSRISILVRCARDELCKARAYARIGRRRARH